jgi:response regulator RpfG family c-di-GMP phosphodiesterase
MVMKDAEGEPRTTTEMAAVLAVDDEPAVLSALTRLLRPHGVRLLTATSGPEALLLLEDQAASVGVLISDYAMPVMNGAELLHAVRLRWPDITRVLLTGNADLPAAARAVNEGQLSSLYTKPWKTDELRQAVSQALDQYRIVVENRQLRVLADEQALRLEQWNQRLEGMVAERTAELEQANAGLQRSLLETVRMLLTSLEYRLPLRAAHCKEVARLAGRLAERAGMHSDEARRVQVAALVHDVGLASLPDAILRRPPLELSLNARTQYQRHAAIGQRMLSAVEDLTDMASWVRHHHERWDGRGYPDRLAGNSIPLPARLIALADGYLEATGFEAGTAPRWRKAQEMSGAFDPELLRVLDVEVRGQSLGELHESGELAAESVEWARPDAGSVNDEDHRRVQPGVGITEDVQTVAVCVDTLRAGMVLCDEVHMTSGAVLLRAGERLTADHVQRIQLFYTDGVLLTTVVAVAVESLVTGSAPPPAQGQK